MRPNSSRALLRNHSHAGGGKLKKSGNGTRYEFSVYIARPARQSDLAIARLRALCDEAIPNKYDIKVVDLSKNPKLAREHDILALPAIFRTLPAPLRKSIGDLSDKDRALLGLIRRTAAD